MQSSTDDQIEQTSLRGVAGIYRITLIADGRSYVGQSVNIKKRWQEHQRDLAKGRHHSAHLQRTWDKYGADAFEHVVIEACDLSGLNNSEVHSLLCQREQWWLDELAPAFNAVRVANSPMRGRKHTDESRAKMSANLKGVPKSPEHRAAIAEGKRGKKLTAEHCASMSKARMGKSFATPETRAKMSAAHTGRKHSPETVEHMVSLWTDEKRAAMAVQAQWMNIRQRADLVEFAYGYRILNDSWYAAENLVVS